jgi:hypothetical protein
MQSEKAQGPDRFIGSFFKVSLNIIKADLVAVNYFLISICNISIY